MATQNDNYILLMEDSLRKKIAVLEAIVDMNREQHRVLTESLFDLDLFDETVRAKAEQIDKLEALDDGFAALFDRVREVIGANREAYSDEIKRMQDLIRRITELSVSIEADEQRNKALADKQFGLLKKEIKEAKRSSQMASKYYKSMSHIDSAPQFLDKKH